MRSTADKSCGFSNSLVHISVLFVCFAEVAAL